VKNHLVVSVTQSYFCNIYDVQKVQNKKKAKQTEIYKAGNTEKLLWHGTEVFFNPLNAELNPVCHFLALLGAHHILHISRIRVNTTYFEICDFCIRKGQIWPLEIPVASGRWKSLVGQKEMNLYSIYVMGVIC